MQTPDDRTLLDFVAQFVGLPLEVPMPMTGRDDFTSYRRNPDIPNYLNSVDAWLRDVWPAVTGLQARDWYPKLAKVMDSCQLWELANATARQRCIALWLALEGTLPTCDNSPAESVSATAEKPPV